MGFDIMSLQKGRGPVQARSKADEGRAVLKYIDVEDLVPSEDNFYSMSAIDELAGLIELSGGVKQPGLVVPLGGGKYKTSFRAPSAAGLPPACEAGQGSLSENAVHGGGRRAGAGAGGGRAAGH